MDMFEVGCSYSVLHSDDRCEVVTIADRDSKTVTLTDGRKVRVVIGVSDGGGHEEVLRIDESGAVATGGVVRVCHMRLKNIGECDET